MSNFPKPQCGQVWYWPDLGLSRLVLSVTRDGRAHFMNFTIRKDHWPPAKAELISGPGAPWQSESFVADVNAGYIVDYSNESD